MGGVNNGSVLRILGANSTSTRALFFAVYLPAEVGALNSNKLEARIPSLRTGCNIAQFVHIMRCHMGYHDNVQCAKTALYKQSGT